jgi:hypothetical protein
MSETGFQPRSKTARGVSHIIMLKARLVGDLFCNPGDILEVYDQVSSPLGNLRHAEKRLHSDHAQRLINGGFARAHNPKPGERISSTDGETAALEAATDPGPPKAERALSPRGKGGAI